jgi:hypothetical protein
VAAVRSDGPPLLRRRTGRIAFEITVLDELDRRSVRVFDNADIIKEKFAGIKET